MATKLFVSKLALAAVLLAGCATSGDLSEQISQLEAEVQRQDREIDELEDYSDDLAIELAELSEQVEDLHCDWELTESLKIEDAIKVCE